DDLDLLVAGRLEDDVEGVLLLRGLGAATGTAGGRGRGDRDRRGSGDLEDLLELLHELGELDEGELLERLDELVARQLRHLVSPDWVWFVGGLWGDAGRLRVLLLAQRVDRTGGLRERRVEEVRGLVQRRLGGTRELREQHLPALQVRELLDLGGAQRGTVEVAALEDEERVRLGEVTQRLRDGDRVAVHERDSRRP